VKKNHLASQVNTIGNTSDESEYLDWWTKYNKQEKYQAAQENETSSLNSKTSNHSENVKQKEIILPVVKNEIKSNKSKNKFSIRKVNKLCLQIN
jgi:hypothetical protein